MQQNDSVPSETMNVVAINVTSTTSPTIAIANVTQNERGNVATIHHLQVLHGQVL
jgi:hypothetical protein